MSAVALGGEIYQYSGDTTFNIVQERPYGRLIAFCLALLVLSKRASRPPLPLFRDRKSTRLNSSHSQISYAVFCLKKKNQSLLLDSEPTLVAGQSQPPHAVRVHHTAPGVRGQ